MTIKGVILAAGIGSRLRPITDQKPKCLVRVAGVSILEHQLRAYAMAGVGEVVVVTGYHSEQVAAACQRVGDVRVDLVYNSQYTSTNNMYSLYLAREQVADRPFVLSNGDVVFDPTILKDLVGLADGDWIAADRGSYAQESMKIVVSPEGCVTDISKTIQPGEAYGNSIDLYRFSALGSRGLFASIDDFVETQGRLKEWTEVGLQAMMRADAVSMRPFDIRQRSWVEIDNYDDLSLADRRFSSFCSRLSTKKLFFIDLDGTVYLGDGAIPGAAEWVAGQRAAGVSCFFLSNNSSKSKKDYVVKLSRMGIPAVESDIVLSTDGVIDYLQRRGLRKVFVLGTQALRQSLKEAGIDVDASGVECVVVGYDTELTYQKLARAALFLQAGVEFVATHRDLVCPTPDGPIPDVGSLLSLLETATGRRPSAVFGKPQPEMIAHVLNSRGVGCDEIAIVGDRLYTDFAMAERIGCDFVLVLSGETRREDAEGRDVQPALIVPSIAAICGE